MLPFMETHPDIPGEYYGRWMEAVNNEFGEVIEDNESDNRTEDHSAVDASRSVVSETTREKRISEQEKSVPTQRHSEERKEKNDCNL